MVQNFHLVWLDENIDETNDEWCNSIMKLREVINTINTFVDVNQCIDFITDVEEAAFMIISAAFIDTLVPIISQLTQVQYV